MAVENEAERAIEGSFVVLVVILSGTIISGVHNILLTGVPSAGPWPIDVTLAVWAGTIAGLFATVFFVWWTLVAIGVCANALWKHLSELFEGIPL